MADIIGCRQWVLCGSMRPDQCSSGRRFYAALCEGFYAAEIVGSRRRVLCNPTYAAQGEGFYAVRPVRPTYSALGEGFYAARPVRI